MFYLIIVKAVPWPSREVLSGYAWQSHAGREEVGALELRTANHWQSKKEHNVIHLKGRGKPCVRSQAGAHCNTLRMQHLGLECHSFLHIRISHCLRSISFDVLYSVFKWFRWMSIWRIIKGYSMEARKNTMIWQCKSTFGSGETWCHWLGQSD